MLSASMFVSFWKNLWKKRSGVMLIQMTKLFKLYTGSSPKVNLTGIVDVLNELVRKLENTTEVLQETRKELEELKQKTLGLMNKH